MNYSRSFLFCKSCHKSTPHSCQVVRRDGERRKTYQCHQCDTEFSRPLNATPTPKRG